MGHSSVESAGGADQYWLFSFSQEPGLLRFNYSAARKHSSLRVRFRARVARPANFRRTKRSAHLFGPLRGPRRIRSENWRACAGTRGTLGRQPGLFRIYVSPAPQRSLLKWRSNHRARFRLHDPPRSDAGSWLPECLDGVSDKKRRSVQQPRGVRL